MRSLNDLFKYVGTRLCKMNIIVPKNKGPKSVSCLVWGNNKEMFIELKIYICRFDKNKAQGNHF
jgi:hypothetical protein